MLKKGQTHTKNLVIWTKYVWPFFNIMYEKVSAGSDFEDTVLMA